MHQHVAGHSHACSRRMSMLMASILNASDLSPRPSSNGFASKCSVASWITVTGNADSSTKTCSACCVMACSAVLLHALRTED